jgi:subtilisin family serine protease
MRHWSIAIVLLAGTVQASVIQPDIASVSGDASRSLLGAGKGVTVGIVDTGIDDSHPALRGSMSAAKDFSNSGNTDDGDPYLGHGTGIAGLIVGHDSGGGYTGLAPSAKFVNAKVHDDNQSSIGTGEIWAAQKGAKVMNVSVGNYVPNADTAQLNLLSDYLTEQYGVLIVSAAGNSPYQSAVKGVPNGSYDGIAIGSTVGRKFNYVAADSSVALPTDGRSKPELIAPGDYDTLATANWEEADAYTNVATGTSYASPIVAGIAAQMIGYGKAHDVNTSPLVLKAVLMASAQHVLDNNGDAWSLRTAHHQVDGLHILQPLDAQQGAGQVNGVMAYDLYAKHTDSTVKYSNWKLSSLKVNNTYTLHLGKFKAGETISATMTWLLHVARTPGGPDGLDTSDTFKQAASLADFSLTLLENGKRVVISDSYADNFQYMNLTLPGDGDYSLQVYRYPGFGETTEPFALATMIDAAAVSSRRARLARARVMHSALARPDISALTESALPEPGSLALVALAAGACLARRRRDAA